MKKTYDGFTLPELLVVVLIIGILTAIAVPQYQKVIEKSRAAQALTLLKQVSRACDMYYLRNGTHVSSFAQLDFQVPWTGTQAASTYAIDDSRSNGEWSISLYDSVKNGRGGTSIEIQIERMKGPYKGAGFTISRLPGTNRKIGCYERKQKGYAFKPTPGAYCVQLFHGSGGTGTNVRNYDLP